MNGTQREALEGESRRYQNDLQHETVDLATVDKKEERKALEQQRSGLAVFCTYEGMGSYDGVRRHLSFVVEGCRKENPS